MSPEREPYRGLLHCEQENLAATGLIQSHGVVVIVETHDMQVGAASVNLPCISDHQVQDLIGQSIEQLLNEREVEDLRRLGDGSVFSSRTREHAGQSFDLFIHVDGDLILFEWEPTFAQPRLPRTPLFLRQTEAEAAQELCQLAREFAGCERALVYRFEPDGSGTVRAESCAKGEPKYLGLRFPSTDVPKVARDLYAQIPHRYIHSTNDKPCALLSRQSPEEIDLTQVNLRSVSPYHIRYMKTMGVESSVSIPLMLGGTTLWGLLTLHWPAAAGVSMMVRQQLAKLGSDFMLSLHQAVVDERMQFVDGRRRLLDHFVTAVERNTKLSDHERQQVFDEVAKLQDATGFAFLFDDLWYQQGDCPGMEIIGPISENLFHKSAYGHMATDCISASFAGDAESTSLSSGVNAIWHTSRQGHKRYCMWFKPEAAREVIWGSRLDFNRSDDYGPAHSFGMWQDIMQDHSEPWSPSGHALATGILNIMRERAQ